MTFLQDHSVPIHTVTLVTAHRVLTLRCFPNNAVLFAHLRVFLTLVDIYDAVHQSRSQTIFVVRRCRGKVVSDPRDRVGQILRFSEAFFADALVAVPPSYAEFCSASVASVVVAVSILYKV